MTKDLNSLDNIALSFRVVFPLMLLMFVGYELRKFKITDAPSLDVMNRMIFRLFLPVMLFINIYSMDTAETLNSENAKLLGLALASVLGSALLGHLVFPLLIKEKKKCSVMIQGIFRSNLVIFGIPIVASIYGEEHLGTVSLLAAFTVPLFNILAV
ncbi:MAG: AEC family transporter, partial [Mobilitalea sp.]